MRADDRRDPRCPDRRAFPARRAGGRRTTDPWPEHGTRARYRRGCTCTPCRAANAAYQAHYRYRKARGLLIMGAVVAAAETWRQLRVLTAEYDTKLRRVNGEDVAYGGTAALARRLGLDDRHLQFGRRRCRRGTADRIRQVYQLDILEAPYAEDQPPTA